MDFFGSNCASCRILVPQPCMDPMMAAGDGRSPNHWNAKELSPALDLSERGTFLIRRTYKKSSKVKGETNKFEVEVLLGSPSIDAQKKDYCLYGFPGMGEQRLG